MYEWQWFERQAIQKENTGLHHWGLSEVYSPQLQEREREREGEGWKKKLNKTIPIAFLAGHSLSRSMVTEFRKTKTNKQQ